MSNGCQAHGSPGMAAVGFEGGIDLYGEGAVSTGIISESIYVREMGCDGGKSSIAEPC